MSNFIDLNASEMLETDGGLPFIKTILVVGAVVAAVYGAVQIGAAVGTAMNNNRPCACPRGCGVRGCVC